MPFAACKNNIRRHTNIVTSRGVMTNKNASEKQERDVFRIAETSGITGIAAEVNAPTK